MAKPEPYIDDKGKFHYGHLFRIGDGEQVFESMLTKIHDAENCAGRPCVIHNPSDHSMRDWPLNWRQDRMIFERICPHGVGHPDPDSLWYEEQQMVGEDSKYIGLHGCDGCCSGRELT